MANQDQKIANLLAGAEANLAKMKSAAEHNRRILKRLKSGDTGNWPELDAVLAEGRSLEQVIADMERNLAQMDKVIADGEADLGLQRARLDDSRSRIA